MILYRVDITEYKINEQGASLYFIYTKRQQCTSSSIPWQIHCDSRRKTVNTLSYSGRKTASSITVGPMCKNTTLSIHWSTVDVKHYFIDKLIYRRSKNTTSSIHWYSRYKHYFINTLIYRRSSGGIKGHEGAFAPPSQALPPHTQPHPQLEEKMAFIFGIF